MKHYRTIFEKTGKVSKTRLERLGALDYCEYCKYGDSHHISGKIRLSEKGKGVRNLYGFGHK